jgi:NitT/TauT family transport system ATP-binding protein
MKLDLIKLGKTFPTKEGTLSVFEDINLQISSGQFICLLGPSGCGKSTLINVIAGLEKATSGDALLNGEPILGPGPDKIMMFQEPALFPWLKVVDNVEFGLRMAGVAKDKRRKTALEMLDKVHLTKFKDAYLHQLSGGMKQRVSLARCLTMDSDVLLMDEPFSALDSQTRFILQMELQRIWIETGKTIIFVTHSVEEAVLLADQVVLMSANPGGIKEIFEINLQRPRKVDDLELMTVSRKVLKSLKEEVEKVAKTEFDTDWHLE